MHYTAAPNEPPSLEPCTLAMAEPEGSTETVEPISAGVAEDSTSPTPVQQVSSDPEKMSDLQQQDLSETSSAEKTPQGHPTHIERCSSLDDIERTKHKVLACTTYRNIHLSGGSPLLPLPLPPKIMNFH